MHITDIEYEADGEQMVGHLAVDEFRVGPRPSVLLCHEGPGLDEHVKGRAVRLAGLGYLAFALDYQGGGAGKPLDDAMARLGALIGDRERTQRIARAGLEVLLEQEQSDPSRLAAMGYCFGGTMAVELARSGVDLKAVVGFHPGMPAPAVEDTRAITGKLLFCCGSQDPFVTNESRHAFEQELDDAGVADWRIEVYGGVGHSYTNPRTSDLGIEGVGFDPAADRRAWRSSLDLLEEALGPV